MRRKKSVRSPFRACGSVERGTTRRLLDQEREEGGKGCRGEGRAEKARGGKPGRPMREDRAWKCVGECELVSRESPLSVARGLLPSVILSARPYFVESARARSSVLQSRTCEARFFAGRSVTHTRRAIAIRACLFLEGTRASLSLAPTSTLNGKIIDKIQPHRSDNNDNATLLDAYEWAQCNENVT